MVIALFGFPTLLLTEGSGKNRDDYKCVYTNRTFLCAYDAGHAEASCETCIYFRNERGEAYDAR